jgi:hypothetical protein
LALIARGYRSSNSQAIGDKMGLRHVTCRAEKLSNVKERDVAG